jgi:hypothetical protein
MIWTITLWMAMQGCFVIGDHMTCNSVEIHEAKLGRCKASTDGPETATLGVPACWETPSEPNAAILLPPAKPLFWHMSDEPDEPTTSETAHCEPQKDTLYCYGLVVGAPDIPMTIGRPEEWQCKATPAEHVFEIKTKREPTGQTIVCTYISLNGNPSCRTIPTPKYCPDGNYCKEIVDVTRELWMDGKRLGTIEGLD